MGPERRSSSVANVSAALASLGSPRPSDREHDSLPGHPSAVLVPLYDEEGLAHVVLTRRTLLLRNHGGEVSFPGGRVEPGETLVEGAIREAQEEINLDPELVQVIGELDRLATASSESFIVPYVGGLPGRPETWPNPAEVDAVLHVPLAELADPQIYREEIWTFPNGVDRSIHFFELVGDTVWGATARMLRQLVGIVTGTLGRETYP